jgi:hypothetical protein
MYDVDLTADERVARYVLADYRQRCYRRWSAEKPHLATCPDATVRHLEGNDGEYGCDTGCEYARLEAVIECPHGETAKHQYGYFGDLADILKEIERVPSLDVSDDNDYPPH